MTNFASKLAAFALTVVVSGAMILGAVGPAEIGVAPVQQTQRVA